MKKIIYIFLALLFTNAVWAEGRHAEFSMFYGVLKQPVKTENSFCLEESKQQNCIKLKLDESIRPDLIDQHVEVKGILNQVWGTEGKNSQRMKPMFSIQVITLTKDRSKHD